MNEEKSAKEMTEEELTDMKSKISTLEATNSKLLKENDERKADILRKQGEIMELIRQKEDMHFRMTESLDAKS